MEYPIRSMEFPTFHNVCVCLQDRSLPLSNRTEDPREKQVNEVSDIPPAASADRGH